MGVGGELREEVLPLDDYVLNVVIKLLIRLLLIILGLNTVEHHGHEGLKDADIILVEGKLETLYFKNHILYIIWRLLFHFETI